MGGPKPTHTCACCAVKVCMSCGKRQATPDAHTQQCKYIQRKSIHASQTPPQAGNTSGLDLGLVVAAHCETTLSGNIRHTLGRSLLSTRPALNGVHKHDLCEIESRRAARRTTSPTSRRPPLQGVPALCLPSWGDMQRRNVCANAHGRAPSHKCEVCLQQGPAAGAHQDPKPSHKQLGKREHPHLRWRRRQRRELHKQQEGGKSARTPHGPRAASARMALPRAIVSRLRCDPHISRTCASHSTAGGASRPASSVAVLGCVTHAESSNHPGDVAELRSFRPARGRSLVSATSLAAHDSGVLSPL